MRTAILALLCVGVWGAVAAAQAPAAPDVQAPPAVTLPAPPAPVAMHVKEIVLVEGAPALLLVDEPEQRYLLLFIDFFMANAIRMGIEGPDIQRPLTHDLISILLRRLGARVTRITITELKDNTYYALISVQVNASGELADFDARPSDAIAIAVREHAPIFAAASLLKPLGRPGAPGQLPRAEPPPAAAEPPAKGKT
jgi:uncharacterized protein